ncbi:MAG: tetratricopeptide repeat protein [Spirochaetes bacterium]|nr:tetratricopeptide repeat protein [Spirochaetota bacterium]
MASTTIQVAVFITLLCACFNGRAFSQETAGRGDTHIREADWHAYSMGLFYKSEKDYNKAIDSFLRAAATKKELHRIYFQIAGCYFHLMNFEKANQYAMLSIEQDRRFVKPYLLSYSTQMRLNEHEKAARVMESLLEVHPGMVNAHYSLGNLYYNKLKDQDKALAHYTRIIELSKDQSVDDYYREYSHYYAGYILYRKGDHDASMEHFRKAIELNPASQSSYQILITMLMDYYRLDEAKRYIDAYRENFPENTRLNSYLGRIHYLRDELAALPHLRKASAEMSQDGLLSKALMFEMLHRDSETEGVLKFIIKKYPRYISPHMALGNTYLRQKQKDNALAEYFTAGILLHNVGLFDESRKALLKALSIRDGIPEIYTYLARIYEEKNMMEMAELHYMKSNELKENSKILAHLGYLNSQKNRYDRAMEYFDRAIRLEPGDSNNYFLKGLTYTYSEKYHQAEIHMKKAISLKEDDLYYFYLATVQEKLRKIPDTIDSLKKAIRINPKNSRAYNYLGYLYADRNMLLDTSVKLVEKALELEPGNGAYIDSLGWVYYRQGKYQEALGKLLEAERELEREGAPDPVVFDHIGDAFLKTGRREDAVNYWKKSLKLKDSREIQNKIKTHSMP